MKNNSYNEEGTADILIIDDTPVNLQLLSSILLETGYKVRHAVNPFQALRALDKIKPDLILLDIMMPDMTGYELCKKLKESEKSRDIPIIFISALDDAFDKVLAFDVGGVDYITKPFRVQEVITRVQNQLTLCQQNKKIQAQYKQLKQENCDLKIEEENLYVYLYAIAQDLHNTTNHTAIILKDLIKQMQQESIENTLLENHANSKQESLVSSQPEIRIPIKVVKQIIKSCEQQLNSISTITKLVDPRKLN